MSTKRPLPPIRRLPPLCPDTVREIVGVNDLIEKLTISNCPLSERDKLSIQRHPHEFKIVLSRNVLRDPINYIRVTFIDETKSNTVIVRSRNLLTTLVQDKLDTLYECLSEDYIFWCYSQDNNDGLHYNHMVYDTDNEELVEEQMCTTDKIMKVVYLMLHHSVPVCKNCGRIHNDRDNVGNDIFNAMSSVSDDDAVNWLANLSLKTDGLV